MALLKNIAIKNYRSCLKTTLDLHPRVSVLIGPNGSGKTNILQAIMLLQKLTAEEPRWREVEMPSALGSTIRATFDHDSNRATLTSHIASQADGTNNDVIARSDQRWRLTSKDGRKEAMLLPLASTGPHGPYQFRMSGRRLYRRWTRSGQYSLFPIPEMTKQNSWAFQTINKVSEFCAGIKYYSASQFTNPGSCPVSFEIALEGRALSSVLRRGHARLMYDIYSASKVEGERRYEQFLEIVGPRGLGLISKLGFKEIPTSSVEHSVLVGGKIVKRRRRKVLVVPQFQIGRQKLSPNQLSEGTFKTLALLFHLMVSDSTSLLIEEPEVCVHHGLLSSILELVKSYSHEKQIILSTHSDYVLDHMLPENVFKVSIESHFGTVARYIPRTMTAKEFSALRRYLESEGNLGEFWREGGLGDRL